MTKTKAKNKTAEVVRNGYSYDPMAVTWAEKYSSSIEKVWRRLPNFVGKCIATIAILVLGSSLKGKFKSA